MKNLKMKLKFKTITPVFIGSGEVLEREFHYIVKNNLFLKYDQKVIIAQMAETGNYDFTKDEDLSIEALNTKIDSIGTDTQNLFEYQLPLSETFCDFYNNQKKYKERVDIHEFVNSNGKFYIPGSTVKGCLGILFEPIKLRGNSISERFLIQDSETIGYERFEIIRYEKPRNKNLIVLKPDSEFTINIPKTGNVNKAKLEKNIQAYFSSQINLAKTELTKFPKDHAKSLLDLKKFEKIGDEKGHMLVNLGFGGGGWVKVKNGKFPTATASSESPYKIHIGWCSVEVEEC